jgi:hypothetical protein
LWETIGKVFVSLLLSDPCPQVLVHGLAWKSVAWGWRVLLELWPVMLSNLPRLEVGW